MRDGFSSFAKAIDRIRNRPVSRSMTVSVIPSFAAKWLLPRLPRFQSANPDIHLRLHTSPEAVDLAGGVADVAIRYGVGPYPGLVAHKMFREQFVPLCSPALGLQKPEDLRNATLLHFDWLRPDDATPTWQRWGQVAERSDCLPNAGISFSDDSHAIQAAIAGQGVVLGSPVMVRAEIDAGLLVMPFGPEIKGHYYHYVHTGRGENLREVEAFGDWIMREVASSARIAD